MKRGFIPISLERYVELHLKANPGTDREDLVKRLRYAREAYARGEVCHCGAPIWIIGSAMVGLSCFTCITGEGFPDDDYEIVAIDPRSPEQPMRRRRSKAARRYKARRARAGQERPPS
ncbi:MAG TPA: hypothetical protein VF173_10200 [Thermoanaerobaculia bacterium]|nr:hypothetical protein [Thermoanaerobaculia bacterium]